MRASQGCTRSAFLQEGGYSMLWIRRTTKGKTPNNRDATPKVKSMG